MYGDSDRWVVTGFGTECIGEHTRLSGGESTLGDPPMAHTRLPHLFVPRESNSGGAPRCPPWASVTPQCLWQLTNEDRVATIVPDTNKSQGVEGTRAPRGSLCLSPCFSATKYIGHITQTLHGLTDIRGLNKETKATMEAAGQGPGGPGEKAGGTETYGWSLRNITGMPAPAQGT